MEVTRVTVEEVKERLDRGEPFTLIDTRNRDEWESASTKVAGAIRIDSNEVSQHLDDVPHGRASIVYCSCEHEASSARVAQELTEHGFKNVHPLYGGFAAWEKAGLPVESK